MPEILAKHVKHHKAHKVNPISIANLRPRQKGLPTANPYGRPRKELSITEALREVANMGITEQHDKAKLTYVKAAALTHWQLAVKGDKEAMAFITNRLEGKPRESIDMTSKGEAIGNGHIVIPESRFSDALVILAKSGVSQN